MEMAIRNSGFTTLNMVIFHSYVKVYQRGMLPTFFTKQEVHSIGDLRSTEKILILNGMYK